MMDPRLRTRRFLLPLLARLGATSAACGGGGDAEATASPFPAGVVHGPIVGVPSPGTIVIAWRTATASVGGVEVGPTTAYGAVVTEPAATTDPQGTLPIAAPGAVRHDGFLADGAPLGDDHVVRDRPSPTGTLRLVVAGDLGLDTDLAATRQLGDRGPHAPPRDPLTDDPGREARRGPPPSPAYVVTRKGRSFATTSVTSSVCGPVPRCASTAARTASAIACALPCAFARTTRSRPS